MLTCARCGEENPDRARFCLACGASLEPPELPREVRKRVTILFCDLTGSTALGERVDPEAFRATQRTYFEQARTILERHGGTVEKFIGDAVMAVFGVPQAHEDDAMRAVRAAVELRAAVSAIGLEARIGVNTGEVVAADADALVTGDAVNVAARLEQRAAPGEILIGGETQQLVRDAVSVEAVELAVKGKSEPVAAFRLLDVDPDAPGLVRRLDSPLVGRARELQRLRDDYERTVSQRSAQLFTLLGPPGVGKSRLVEEFVRRTREGARVVSGRCLPYGEGITYWPLVEVLLQLGEDPEPVLALPSPADAAVATRKLFEGHAAEAPLVVIWDDIQWAEPTFLDLIEHVVDWSRGAPLLVLCVARPELLDLRPTWGGGKSNATSLLLEPLAAEETESLIDNLLDGVALSAATRERILVSAGGNPLFVEEMLLMLPNDGDADVTVPPTIHALLQARLDQLASEERSVIERGAIEGEVFHRLPVAELTTERVRTTLDSHLARLIRTELIRPETATMPGDDAFRFRHLLIRDAAYDSLPKETRAELHERFAVWLEEHVELVEQDEVVGYHLEQAALYRLELGKDDSAIAKRASTRLAAAGRAALARGDNNAALGLLERAAHVLPPADPERLELAVDLVFPLVDFGRFPAAQAQVDLLTAAEDERASAYAAALGPVTTHVSGTGSLEEHRDRLAVAVESFRRLGDERGLAIALLVQGHDEWTRCRAAAAAEKYRSAQQHSQRSGRPALTRDAVTNLSATITFGPTPVPDAEAEIRSYLANARSMLLDAALHRGLGRLAAARGDFDAGRELFRRGREPLLEAGDILHYAGTCQGSAFIEEQAGDPEAAIGVLRDGYDQLARLGERAYASTVAADLAKNLFRTGRDDEAARWVATARELAPPGDVSSLATSDLVDALLNARRARNDDAERLVVRGVALADTTDFWELRGYAYETLAGVLAAAERTDEARTAMKTAIDVYAAKQASVAEAKARSVLAEL